MKLLKLPELFCEHLCIFLGWRSIALIKLLKASMSQNELQNGG